MHTLITRMWAEILSGRTTFVLADNNKAIAIRAQLNRYRKRLEPKLDPATGISLAQKHYEYSLLVRDNLIVVEPAVPEELLNELFPHRQTHESAMAQLKPPTPIGPAQSADIFEMNPGIFDANTRRMLEAARRAEEEDRAAGLLPPATTIKSSALDPEEPLLPAGPKKSLTLGEIEDVRARVHALREQEAAEAEANKKKD